MIFPLLLILAGVAMVVVARSMDDRATFNDGSFVIELLLALGGAGCVIAGSIWLVVFLALMAF